ncbi:L-lactate dehydrogenase complex protein LldG [Sphingobacterium allocomposti]|jgi:L-lactate dehydrogenase complex protein LldG|uniref:L-lactate dehydrogenase complex protein LldG n=1 Tax=Sphingobacterium allocomposti TaxID=415956 RepID=A0A5S5DH82_9SPHI|nr:LUD domain-containing protein [Sphingobacterium composti Yoo et al. 2007 non Ten et al. 2007]TYP94708.1 L-lactate dehydrogenase complex protein LldG [Sphingobacterium composti Yoo et al. 2007 non Ten et al. 2007]HLS94372.1 LUD domain-containing protein [Sphingobacterium sp.]
MNIKNTTAKERMLKKIRQALLQKRDNPHMDFEDSPLYKDEEESLDVTFARELTRASGNFVYCDGEIALIENLILLAEKLKVKKIFAWEKDIQGLLGSYGFPVYTSDHNFEAADVGITTCEALIARNGSVLVSNANAAGRRLSIYPPVHIVVAKASQLVMDIKHGLRRLAERYPNELPSMVTLITGPSRTADIEKMLVLGAHGPKDLYVFLVEDRF